MQKRDVIHMVLEGKSPPYVPWWCWFTYEAVMKLNAYYGDDDFDTHIQNHIVGLGSGIGYFSQVGENLYEDHFGVLWDRSVEKDIGVVRNRLLPQPTLHGFTFPDPLEERVFAEIPTGIARFPDRFRLFQIGFSLYERAWTLRGMENLLTDFIENPAFARDLLETIADYNIAQLLHAIAHYDVDAVYFGDDWGQQKGLQMGPRLWKKFLYPPLKRMYQAVRQAGKYVFIHSCGDVDELFPELIEMGVNCFNPFQPEVMDVHALMQQYRGRLVFHGGLSTQQILPYGTVEDVRRETRRLLEAGMHGGYIFAPAHGVEGDVPLENMLAFLELIHNQPGFTG